MSVTLPETVRIPETVLWQEVGEEIVILDLRGNRYRSLNDVGSAMWRTLDECRDVASAHAQLCERYEVDPEVLREDLGSFIARLVELELLRTQ
jgi:hypothetical protein